MIHYLTFPRSSDHLFVHVPAALNQAYLQEILVRHSGEAGKIRRIRVENPCAGMFGGTACSGATLLRLQIEFSDGRTMELVAKILSPDPVNLYKIDCRYDSRIAEVRWMDWWGKRGKPWVPEIYDTRLNSSRREFWIVREYLPRIGWHDVTEGDWGQFRLDDERLRLLVETVAELHGESYLAIDELRRLFPEPDIRQGGECRLDDLEIALDEVIADDGLFQVLGMGDEERDKIKVYRERVAQRPDWLEDWRTVCVTADLKPDNFGFRANDGKHPVIFDLGAARLAPMEEELALLLKRLNADENMTEMVLTVYLDRFTECTGEPVSAEDFKRRLSWAEPLLLMRSLVEQVNALRWVPWQNRSKGYIHYFLWAVGQQFEQCSCT